MLRATLKSAESPLVTAVVSFLLLAVVALVGWLTFQFHFAPSELKPTPPRVAAVRSPSQSMPGKNAASAGAALPAPPAEKALGNPPPGESTVSGKTENPLPQPNTESITVTPAGTTPTGTADTARAIAPEVARRMAPQIVPQERRDPADTAVAGIAPHISEADSQTADNLDPGAKDAGGAGDAEVSEPPPPSEIASAASPPVPRATATDSDLNEIPANTASAPKTDQPAGNFEVAATPPPVPHKKNPPHLRKPANLIKVPTAVLPSSPDEPKPAVTDPAAGTVPLAKSPPPAAAIAESEPAVRYSVQIGAFRKRGNAQRLVKRFQLKGYDPYLTDLKDSTGGTWYVVRLGDHSEYEVALLVARAFEHKEGITTVLTKFGSLSPVPDPPTGPLPPGSPPGSAPGEKQ